MSVQSFRHRAIGEKEERQGAMSEELASMGLYGVSLAWV